MNSCSEYSAAAHLCLKSELNNSWNKLTGNDIGVIDILPRLWDFQECSLATVHYAILKKGARCRSEGFALWKLSLFSKGKEELAHNL